MKRVFFAHGSIVPLTLGLVLVAGTVVLPTTVQAASSIEVPVTDSTAVHRTVEKRIPRKECWDEEQRVRVPCAGRGGRVDRNSIGLDTIIGAGIGAGIGNLIDNDTGADTGKAVGGLLGAFFANQAREGAYASNEVCYERRTRERCETRYETIQEERIVGYRNCAIVRGQELCIESKRPLRYLRIGIVGSR